MLTDYHVHLRRDDPEHTAADAFTAANADRYRAVATERGIAELGVAEHVYRFERALDVWDHPLWRAYAVDDLDAYCDFVRDETDLRLGIEADFIPRCEDRLAALLESQDFDYVVGSVHFVGDAAVDYEPYDIWRTGHSAERIWRGYFATVAEAARSGLFDIMAHPDLVKVWGSARPLPSGDLRFYYEPAVEAFAEAGVAIEVSTAGWRKPADELYPARALLEMCLDAGCPVALSSDAHVPEELGYRYEDAVGELEDSGVGELCVFDQRVRRLEPIGAD
jgi:histidinol-phosphatase (PHP family)